MFLVNPILIPVYLAAVLSGLLAGSVSPALAYSKSVTFGITLMHSVLAGALIGVYLHDALHLPVNPLLTAVVMSLTASLLTAEAVARGFPEDAAVAISVSVSVSVAVIMTYIVALTTPYGVSKAFGYVFGVSALATWHDVVRLAAVLVMVIPLIHLFWCEFKYVAFDPEGAEAMGLPVRAYRYLYYFTASVAAASLAMSLGVLLAHIIISVPGLLALRVRSPNPFKLSYFVSVAVMTIGYALAWSLNIPPSGGVGVVASGALVTLLVMRRES